MLTWAFNKDNMSFKLCGTYETMFHTDRKGDEKSRVYINECDYEIPKDVVDNHFSDLQFNPFTEYKFIVNKEKYDEYNFWGGFPYGGFFVSACVVNNDNEIIKDGFYPQSNSREIRILEEFFNCIGYDSVIGRFNWREVKEYEENGYKLVLWYGAAKNNAMFVKER